MPCTAQMARVMARMRKRFVVPAASSRLNLPPRKRSMSQGARAIIQAETIMPTAKRRETGRETEAGNSWARARWWREGEKGREAAPGAGPRTLKGGVERGLAVERRV